LRTLGAVKVAPVFTDLESARRSFLVLGERLAARAITFRAPPPEPTTCCGRGCNGCVWDGYYAALGWWLDDAAEALGPGAT